MKPKPQLIIGIIIMTGIVAFLILIYVSKIVEEESIKEDKAIQIATSIGNRWYGNVYDVKCEPNADIFESSDVWWCDYYFDGVRHSVDVDINEGREAFP